MCNNLSSSSPCETHSWGLPEHTGIADKYAEHATEVVRHEVSDKLTGKANHKTLVVNLFAGPGAGKSTTAAGIFFELKSRGINCELAAEYAKDLCWEQRHHTFQDQIYIFGKQYHRIYRLLGQVDCVITDSPILLTPVYDGEKRPTLEQLAIEEHNKMWTYNTFLKRVKAFNPKGRNQNHEESKQLDMIIADTLCKHRIPFETFEGTPEGKNAIVRKILMLLNKET